MMIWPVFVVLVLALLVCAYETVWKVAVLCYVLVFGELNARKARVVVVDQTQMGDVGVARILRGVMQNKDITKLALREVQMSSKSVPGLVEVVKRCKSLTELDLYGNHRLGKSVESVFEAALEEGRLQSLNIGCCGGFSAWNVFPLLLKHKKTSALSSLDITGNLGFVDADIWLKSEGLGRVLRERHLFGAACAKPQPIVRRSSCGDCRSSQEQQETQTS